MCEFEYPRWGGCGLVEGGWAWIGEEWMWIDGGGVGKVDMNWWGKGGRESVVGGRVA
jgi:hypothetical protein